MWNWEHEPKGNVVYRCLKDWGETWEKVITMEDGKQRTERM